MTLSVPHGEAGASLDRLIERFRFIPHAAGEWPGPGPSPLQRVQEWRVRLNRNDLSPNALPRMMGAEANVLSAHPRLARALLEERRLLEHMGGAQDRHYGSVGFFGHDRARRGDDETSD